MGMNNVIVMIPFCRTPEECKKVYLDDEKNLGNGKTKILYNMWKNNEDIHEIRIPGYNNIVQTQLITSRGKPKTYYATFDKDIITSSSPSIL